MCKACEMGDLLARSCHANGGQSGYTGKQGRQERLEKTVRKGAVTDFDSAATLPQFWQTGPRPGRCSLLFTIY